MKSRLPMNSLEENFTVVASWALSEISNRNSPNHLIWEVKNYPRFAKMCSHKWKICYEV